MAIDYRRRRGNRRYPKRARRGYRRSRPLSAKAVRKIVKQVVSREAETKMVQYFTTGRDILPSSASGFIDTITPVSPYTGQLEIAQGVGQGERIGNRVKIKSLNIKGTIFPLPYNASTNPTPVPVQVVLWFFYSRQTPSTTPGGLTGGFLQEGDSTRNLQNNLSDLVSRVNNDAYRLLARRVFKIGYGAYGGTGTQAAFQGFVNNDFKLNRNFSIPLTRHAVKTVIYNDASSNTPRSRGIFMMAQAIAADGSSLANNIIPAAMTYQMECTYEDM